MAYTFWHSGVLIGESDLDMPSDHPGQRGGVFRPTAYGEEIFPRLSGTLTALHGIRADLKAKGVAPDAARGDEIADLFDTTPAGRKFLDIGRMLSEVEVRGPDGRRMEFASIAFSDPREIHRLMLELAIDGAEALEDLPPDAPHYVVSATFRTGAAASTAAGRAARRLRRHWSNDN
jgi:hypothetical protein